MAISINSSQLNHKHLSQIKADLELEIPISANTKFPKFKPLICYTLNNDDTLFLPFSYAISSLEMVRPSRTNYKQSDILFSSELRPEQIEVKDEAIALLNKKGHVMIASYTGFGKSILGVYLGCLTKLKILVIIPNKTVLIPQWVESFEKFCTNVKVQVLSSKDSILDENSNVYIMNALTAGKKDPTFFKGIGTVIVDESHLIAAEMLIKSMHNVCPRYLIGLSATPYRNDGLDILIKLHFGKDVIERKMNRKHYAYFIKTGFTPEVEHDNKGKIIWNSIINSQSNNPDRNKLIATIANKHNDRVFLILVKRVEQAKEIGRLLVELGETKVSVLHGNEKEVDQESRIIIGTQQKCGIGFDFPRLDALILGNDLEDYFIQSLGRIFRRKDSIPIVFDLVDNHPILIKHWKTRRTIYLEHGGIIQEYNLNQ